MEKCPNKSIYYLSKDKFDEYKNQMFDYIDSGRLLISPMKHENGTTRQ